MSAEPAPPLEAEVRGSGPAVVLLHGQPGTGADWQWVAPLLEDRYTVVVPDRPGYGLTGGRATGFSGNARAVVDLLDRLGIERPVLAGHSWAGGVALAVAERFPGRTAGLVLVSSVAPGEPAGWDDRLLAAPLLGDLLAAAAVGGLGVALASRRLRRLALRAGSAGPDALAALGRLTAGRAAVWRSFVTEQRALVAELGGLGPGLAWIRAPVAVVHGRNDRLVPLDVAGQLASAIPGATLHVLEGVGHLLPHDRPAEVAAAVDSVSARARGASRAGPGSGEQEPGAHTDR